MTHRCKLAARRLGALFVAGLCLAASAAHAEGDSPARALFKEGRALASEGKYAEACPKFEQSLALEVGVGTQFNLADCWEHIGRTASAQKLFLGAAASAKAAGQADREQVLRERAAALEPRISKLVIDVSDSSPRLTVKCDELPLDQEQWGKALAVDAGKYEILAKAPGKKPWQKTVEVKPGTPVVSVEVPVLEALEPEPKPAAAAVPHVAEKTAPSSPATAPSEPPRDRGSRGPNYRALTLGGFGVVALTAGTIMGFKYKSNNDDAKAICPSNINCTPKQIQDHDRLVDDARGQRTWMFVGVGVGALSLAGAAALYIWEKPQTSSASVRALPAFGRNEVGASLVGRF
jgi:serine/threonine-protein kinase